MNNKDLSERYADGATHGKGSHMFIEGDTIYSYGHHFAIAKRFTDNIFLFNPRDYSGSTQRHKSHVRHAIGYGYNMIVIEVKNCAPENAQEQIEQNNSEIKEVGEKLKRARSENMQSAHKERIAYLERQNSHIRKELKKFLPKGG